MKTFVLMGVALALLLLSAAGAHAELSAHAVVVDSTLKLPDGTTNNGVRLMMASIPDSERERYQLIRVHNRLPPSWVFRGHRVAFDFQRWNNGRLDIYAKNMTAQRLQVVLAMNGLHASIMTVPSPAGSGGSAARG